MATISNIFIKYDVFTGNNWKLFLQMRTKFCTAVEEILLSGSQKIRQNISTMKHNETKQWAHGLKKKQSG